MDMSEYIITSSFVKAEDVKQGKNAFVITGSEFVTNKFEKRRLHLHGELNKEERTFDCSPTNAQIIADVLGRETEKWVGCILYLETYKMKNSEGKLIDIVSVKEAKRLPLPIIEQVKIQAEEFVG